MDSIVRVAGKMVVWHEAAAEVSTAITSNLTMIVGRAILPRAYIASSELSVTKSGPSNETAPYDTVR